MVKIINEKQTTNTTTPATSNIFNDQNNLKKKKEKEKKEITKADIVKLFYKFDSDVYIRIPITRLRELGFTMKELEAIKNSKDLVEL